MRAKIEKKSDKIGTFGGIFQTIDFFRHLGLSELVDNTLENRRFNAKYRPSEIVEGLLANYCSGGTCIEDANTFRTDTYTRGGYRFSSPDTIHKLFRENEVPDTVVTSDSGNEYNFNINARLGDLLVKALLKSGQLAKDRTCDFDYDNVLLACEKYDARWSYKKCRGYFPGVAMADGLVVGVENRDGNANVKTAQPDTLRRIYRTLESNGIHVRNSRMDCGSYSKDIVEVVARYSKRFYIRANMCSSLSARISELPEEAWTDALIGYQKCQLASIEFESFFPERKYRLVVQRTPVEEGGQLSLLDGRFIVRTVLTNDWDSTEDEVVLYYNQRGSEERVFDEMNNDFGWGHLPASDMSTNTVFMLLTALLRNFMMWFKQLISRKFGSNIAETSRMKNVVRNFMTVPFKWVVKGGQMWLRLYTDRPYDCLRL